MHRKLVASAYAAAAVLRVMCAAFPLLVVAAHYIVVAAWLGERDCAETNLQAFAGYWTCMLCLSGLVAAADAAFVQWRRWWQHALFATWCALLAMAQFVTWSFIRAKPFKCFDDGRVFTYVSGPLALAVVQVVVLVHASVLVWLAHRRDLRSYMGFFLVSDGDTASTRTPFVLATELADSSNGDSKRHANGSDNA